MVTGMALLASFGSAQARQAAPTAQVTAAAPAAQEAAPQLPDHKTLELNQWYFWAIDQAKEGRAFILGKMLEVLAAEVRSARHALSSV